MTNVNLYQVLNLPSPKETRAILFRNSEDEILREKKRKTVEKEMIGYCEGYKHPGVPYSEDLSKLKGWIDELNLDKSQVKQPPYKGLISTRQDGAEWGAPYIRILLEQYWGFVPRDFLFKDPLDNSETLYKAKVSRIINNLLLWRMDITKTRETLGEAGALGLIIVHSHEERMKKKKKEKPRYSPKGKPNYARDKRWKTAKNMGITTGVGIEETVEEARKLIEIEIIKLSECQMGSDFNSYKYYKDCFISELYEFDNDPLIPNNWRFGRSYQ